MAKLDMCNPVVGDVAKLDMLNIDMYMAYPVVGDEAKLDIFPQFLHVAFLCLRNIGSNIMCKY